MIFESKQEEQAFDFVCNLASNYTDSVCNDLTDEEVEKFKGLEVEGEDENGNKILNPILADYNVIHWLECRKNKPSNFVKELKAFLLETEGVEFDCWVEQLDELLLKHLGIKNES